MVHMILTRISDRIFNFYKSSFYGYKFSREGLNQDRIDRYVHDAVADFTLIYDHTNGWTKGPELNSRRFGHTSFIYDADKKSMIYHVGGGQSEGQAMNGIERWKIGTFFSLLPSYTSSIFNLSLKI